jgi:hypothetical protein
MLSVVKYKHQGGFKLMQSDTVATLQQRVDRLHSEKSDIQRNVFDQALSKFEESGGCDKCRGRGWIVTWDTLDSMTGCYHESATCDVAGCTRETRERSGLHPANNKYDNFHTASTWVATYTAEETAQIRDLDERMLNLKSEIQAEKIRMTPAANKLVEVISSGKGPKNRRVPVGTTGLVKKVFRNNYGTEKAIVIDSKGKKWWPQTRQLRVIDDSPDMAEWIELEKRELESTGTPVIATVMRKSAKAALIQVTTGEEMWIPIGQVPDLREKKKGETCAIILPTWLAKNKKLTN